MHMQVDAAMAFLVHNASFCMLPDHAAYARPAAMHTQLVPAVTELMVAELLYLEKQGHNLPIEMLINSSGTTRQDGEIVSVALSC